MSLLRKPLVAYATRFGLPIGQRVYTNFKQLDIDIYFDHWDFANVSS